MRVRILCFGALLNDTGADHTLGPLLYVVRRYRKDTRTGRWVGVVVMGRVPFQDDFEAAAGKKRLPPARSTVSVFIMFILTSERPRCGLFPPGHGAGSRGTDRARLFLPAPENARTT